MSLIHDIIKIKYVREGYLPNWPYHLISDEEMLDTFLHHNASTNTYTGYFVDTYPMVDSDLSTVYNNLVSYIYTTIVDIQKTLDASIVLPDWIYSYMLGAVIGPHSSKQDIHDLLVLLGTDNIDDVFTPLAATACYNISKSWVNKLSTYNDTYRPPTCFGEPHVIKSLRLM